MQKNRHVLLFFVDGLGLAPAGPDNPWGYLPTANLRSLLPGGLTVASAGLSTELATLSALDTTLGVPGLPQSASGQTALLTGVNAPGLLGRHLSGYPDSSLVQLLAEHSLFRRLSEQGISATFANAFYDDYWREFPSGPHSATTEAVLTAGLPLRTQSDLRQGNAVYQDITNLILQRRSLELPLITPALAGERLAHIVRQHHFTLFEFFQTDVAAHKGRRELLEQHIQNIDAMMGAVLANSNLHDLWVILASDHGNSEDLSTSDHTLNQVPGLSVGANSATARAWRSIIDIAESIVGWLLTSD